jgi:hypothetical protein
MKLFKTTKVFTAVALGYMLLVALPAMADVVGRVTHVNTATRSIEINGVGYSLPVDVQVKKRSGKGFEKIQLTDLKKGQFVEFKNRDATLTRIEVLAQEVDMPTTFPMLLPPR